MIIQDTKNIIGNIFPKPEIKRLTIENLVNNKTNLNKLGNNVPITFAKDRLGERSVQATSIKKEENNTLTSVTINWSLRDLIDDAGFGTWFLDDIFLQNLKIKIIQSLDPELTELLNNNILDPKIKKYKTLNSYKEQIESLPIKDPSEIFKETELFSEDGKRFYEIDYTNQFSLSGEPEHVAYFLYSYIDIEELLNFEVNFKLANNLNNNSEVATILLFDEQEIQTTSSIFIDPDSEIWSGEVFNDELGWYGEMNGVRVELIKEEVLNTKIDDVRSSQKSVEIDDLIIPLSSIDNKINKSLKEDTIKNISYIIDGFSSKNNNNSYYIFGLDLYSIIYANGLYNGLFRRNQNRILPNVKINNISIIRNKVLKEPQTENYYIDTDNNRPVLILSSKENSINNDKVLFEGIDILLNKKGRYRFYYFIDKTIDKITDGLYQYNIEINLEDYSKTFLNQTYQKGIKGFLLINEYYRFASTRNNFNFETNKFTDNLISYYEEINKEPWADSLDIYFEIVNKFFNINTKKEVNLIFSHINPYTGNLKGLELYIEYYTNLLRRIANLLGVTFTGSNYTSRGGTSFGSSVQKSFIVINKNLKNVYDASYSNQSGYKFINLDNESVKISTNLLKQRVDKEFDKYWRESNPNTIESVIKNENLPGILGDKKKLTNIANTQYSFLTPEKITLGFTKELNLLDQGESLWDSDKYLDFSNSLIRITSLSKESKVLPKTELSDSLLESSFTNITKTKSTSNKINVTIDETADKTKMIVSNVLAQNKKVKDTTTKDIKNIIVEKSKTKSKISSFIKENPFNSNIANYSLSKRKNLIDSSFRNSPITDEQAESIPMQIKSLFFSNSKLSRNNWFNEEIDVINNFQTKDMMFFNYSVIGKLEYLFDIKIREEDEIILNNLEWKKLTKKVLIDNKGQLFCRIMFYENRELNVQIPNKFRLPILNQYFIVDNGLEQESLSVENTSYSEFTKKVKRNRNNFIFDSLAIKKRNKNAN